MAKAKAARLKLAVHDGHKGPALVFPFDPAETWGKRTRHFVGGTVNGVRFIGEIGFRRRVFYTLLDDELVALAGIKHGDVAEVSVEPREGDAADLASPTNLVWSRLAAPAAKVMSKAGALVAKAPKRKSKTTKSRRSRDV